MILIIWMQKISQGRRVGIFPLAIINIHDNRKIDNNSSIKVVFIPQSGQQDSSKKYTQRFGFLEDCSCCSWSITSALSICIVLDEALESQPTIRKNIVKLQIYPNIIYPQSFRLPLLKYRKCTQNGFIMFLEMLMNFVSLKLCSLVCFHSRFEHFIFFFFHFLGFLRCLSSFICFVLFTFFLGFGIDYWGSSLFDKWDVGLDFRFSAFGWFCFADVLRRIFIRFEGVFLIPWMVYQLVVRIKYQLQFLDFCRGPLLR